MSPSAGSMMSIAKAFSDIIAATHHDKFGGGEAEGLCGRFFRGQGVHCPRLFRSDGESVRLRSRLHVYRARPPVERGRRRSGALPTEPHHHIAPVRQSAERAPG